ncbi:MAG TPA: response regulator transcription factor [Nitriliruptoraceae bacterium]|nr:response regulator transcription factor [Nitriliruptoraceae bacterium]
MARVLLIEDDDQIATSLARLLRRKGHEVVRAERASAGLSAVVDDSPDVVVLDLGLPDIDGMDVIRMVRGLSSVPIIVATARDDEDTIVAALDRGADDFVGKPYSGRQLDARIRALLRRERTLDAPVLQVGDLRVDRATHEVQLGDEVLDLRPKEFDLLALLAARSPEVVRRATIAQEVWDDPFSASDATIDVHLSALRRRLGETAAAPRYLRVIRGVGVKLVAPEPAT